MRHPLLFVLLSAPFLSLHPYAMAQESGPTAPAEDTSRRTRLAALTWLAVDAPEALFPQALALVKASPDVTWKEVAAVLRRGRDYASLPPPAPAVADAAAHAAYFADFPWEPGVVRRYDLGDDAGHWYSVVLPEGYDGAEPVPVWFDLGLFSEGGPPGFAVVRLNDHITGAASLGRAPMSMTAGYAIQSILLSVVADLERRFNADRNRVLCGGYSRTGNAALYEGVHWPDLWAGIAVASGYYAFDDALLPNLDHVALLAASGKDQGHRDSNAWTATVARKLKASGHAAVTVHTPEGRAVDDLGEPFLRWVREPRRDPLPRTFSYTLVDPRHRGAWWVDIERVKSPGRPRKVVIGAPGDTTAESFETNSRPASVAVEVTAPDEVRLKAVNVAEVRLRLSPDLFDLEKPLRLVLPGRTVSINPEPSLETLLRNYRRNGDRERLFPAEVVVKM